MLLHQLNLYLLLGIPGGSEWIIILVIVVILFGAKKIPSLARSLGKGITEFKGGLKDTSPIDDEEKPKLDDGSDVKQLEDKSGSDKKE